VAVAAASFAANASVAAVTSARLMEGLDSGFWLTTRLVSDERLTFEAVVDGTVEAEADEITEAVGV